MSKRFMIWIAVVIAGVGVVVALQRIKKTAMEQEGRVTYRNKSGDLMQFFAQQFERYGGTQRVARTLPSLRAEWSYAEDTNGFQILLSRDKETEFVRCLTQTYGSPVLSDGYPHLLYRSGAVGATITANTREDPMHIIVLRAGALHDERLPMGGTNYGQ